MMYRVPNSIGIVVIGRNEGERLRKCLESVIPAAACIVYVDSGSTDGSSGMANAMGVHLIDLDMGMPFTAARARNEGFQRLRDIASNINYVQFVDGDCEIAADWIGNARTFLDGHPEIAVVSGRLSERYPEQSVYNMLCDIEWDTPVGEARACGGNAMMRITAFESAGGFRDDLIAGEEPDLCIRLRASGWKIWRVEDEMALHDAAMKHFGQWWKRAQRTGYSFAEGAAMHGALPERHWVRESRSALLWGLALPLFAVLCTVLLGPMSLIMFAIYPLQIIRLAARAHRSNRENWWYAIFLVIGKFPEMLGHLKFLAHSCRGGHARLIEHK